MAKTVNIAFGGEAGQGLATVGEILCKCLVRSGYSITAAQSYMSRIRGGHNSFAVRAGTEPVIAPAENVDILIAFDADTLAIHKSELTASSLVLVDKALKKDGEKYIAIPYKDLAPSSFINITALGVVGFLLGLDKKLVQKTVADQFQTKDEELAKSNEDAVEKAYAWAAGAKLPTTKKLAAPLKGDRKLTLNGNQAISLGALSVGIKFCSFYPMTPATSIVLGLIKHADEMGIVVEQAEDEISAINMALGASYAGAPAMVATSGGGFALMVEGLSLAGMTETPIVIAIAQRPGPATGLPTRTEQGDLEFVLHAAHGEFPRAIFAPGTPEECFYLTRKAFHLAERYQSPVFILTDQFLADSFHDVTPFDVANLLALVPGAESVTTAKPYKRFAVTESGVSPRLLPGLSGNLVVADSDEHSEDGHITEDLEVRKLMVKKRLRKYEGLKSAVIPPEIQGQAEPDLMLVCWGSSKGAVQEAAQILNAKGIKTSTMHFRQVWPLMPRHFIGYLVEAKKVICVESNATGQFANIIRQQTGFYIDDRINRYDGLPLTPEYIVKHVQKRERGGLGW
jgi:2-oxoglutarate ferredoxin oxidoreductase subunit alpha